MNYIHSVASLAKCDLEPSRDYIGYQANYSSWPRKTVFRVNLLKQTVKTATAKLTYNSVVTILVFC